MVNQLLTEMDGFRKNELVFVVGIGAVFVGVGATAWPSRSWRCAPSVASVFR